MEDNNNYIESNSYQEDNYENESFNNNDSNDNLYIDGDEKRPKLVIIFGAIGLILLIVLICFFACGKREKSDNKFLKNLSVTGGELSPDFTKEQLVYNVYATNDVVVITCSSEDTKSSIKGCNQRIQVKNECISHEVVVTAQNGTKNNYILNICKKDEDAPIIKEVKISPTKYTNSYVTVTVKAEAVGTKQISKYSFDGGITYQNSNKFKVYENQTLNIIVKDTEDVISQIITKKIENIDNTKPSVKITGNVDSGIESSSSVVLSSTVDPESSISGYTYQWYKNDSKITGANGSIFKASSSGTYKLVVKTNSGNSATSNKYIVKIKGKIVPSSNDIKISSVSGNPTNWTNKPITLKVIASSSNGISGYSFDGGKTYQTSNSKTFDSNKNVTIVVKDKKGNIDTKSINITKIDTTVPSISITGNDVTGSTLSVNVNPSSTISGYTYTWSLDGNVISNNKSITASKSGKYQITVKTGAGNTVSATKTITEPIKPTVSISAKTQSGNSYTSGTKTNEKVTLTANVKNGTATSYKWYKDNILYVSGVSTITVNKSGEYKLIINDSITSTNIVKVVISTSTPKLTIDARLSSYSGSSYNPGSWTNKDVYITVNATGFDDLKDLQFQYEDGGDTWYYGATSAWTSKTVSNTNGKATVIFYESTTLKARAKTDSGDIIYTDKITIKIDKTAPYTPYVSSFSSNQSGSCFIDKTITDDGINKLRNKNVACIFYGNLNLNYKSSDNSNGSGIDVCHFIYEDNGGIKHGKLGDLDIEVDSKSVNIVGINTSNVWTKAISFTPKGNEATQVIKCYDKAGNASPLLAVRMFK